MDGWNETHDDKGDESLFSTLHSYGTMTSCEASAENGVNEAVRPNLSVPVTV